jgi:hypothetical protein
MAYCGGSTWSWSYSEIAVQGHYLSYRNFRITTPRGKLTCRKKTAGGELILGLQQTCGSTGHVSQP